MNAALAIVRLKLLAVRFTSSAGACATCLTVVVSLLPTCVNSSLKLASFELLSDAGKRDKCGDLL